MGTGLGHYIPLVAYLGFWVMTLVSLSGKPLYGLYYMIPFLPYRTMRDHFLDYPLGHSVLTILVFAVLIGALLQGKRLPKSKLYFLWAVIGVYLYCSLWLGTALGNAPAPLWLNDPNFVTWKDYILIPLIFAAAGLVIEDRKQIRMVILLTAISLIFIDRSCLMDSLNRTWTNFDEDKRGGGPLGYGSNQTAAFLAQFAMFFWGFGQFLKRKKLKLLSYGLVAITLLATMYTFSRASYLAVLFAVFIFGLVKNRKLLLVLGVFLLTWQSIVPTAVHQRVSMTENANGQLEASAQERVNLWDNAWKGILRSPIVGNGYATFQLGEHVDNLKDTHNWYVKVLVETGLVGLIFVLILLTQIILLAWRLFRRATDPLYRGLGLGLLLCMSSCLVANFFGDRWTYLEITGLLWVVIAAATRAFDLTNSESDTQLDALEPAPVSPYAEYIQKFAPRS
ncbi:O-antigen ligase family protein [Edaphobacter sp.]|uniref:O-antigen ligase family protein n=1 Tax=Edaphobacter sp. TaxID=1934404 RepID=UPI002DBAF250|nr:O-antigen ligase family protein [Edaphobacter sp.]HEU5340732.1 O-antigen ligase family protein [Edaphobacter sp.]